MPKIKHRFKLDLEEREELGRIARSQVVAAVKVSRAKAILAMDEGEFGEGLTREEASSRSGLAVRSLDRLRARVCEVGPLGALERKARETPPVEPKITGEVEAHITQIACSEPPEGASRWTLAMIAERLVELEIVESISGEAVRYTLKKTSSSLGNRGAGAFHRSKTPLL